MYRKYRVIDTGYEMTGTMGSGETFCFDYEVILYVKNSFVEMVEMDKYISHQDIERYYLMSVEEYLEHEMVAYRCNQEDVEFRSLEPLNQDGYIVVRDYTDFSDLSVIKRNWVYAKALNDNGKIDFKKYIKEYCEDKEYEIIE